MRSRFSPRRAVPFGARIGSTEGTIEERVLRLHASKRALYANAIGELGAATKLDVAVLVDLMREDSPRTA